MLFILLLLIFFGSYAILFLPAPDFRLGVYAVLHIDIQEGRGATLDSLPAFILNFLIDFFLEKQAELGFHS